MQFFWFGAILLCAALLPVFWQKTGAVGIK